MLLGSASVPVFAIIYALSVESLGIWGAIPVAYITAVLVVSTPVTFFLRWRREQGRYSLMSNAIDEVDRAFQEDEDALIGGVEMREAELRSLSEA